MPGVLPGRSDPVQTARHVCSHSDAAASDDRIIPNEKRPMQVYGWSPYQDNGGTALGVAGKGFAVLAADTRMSNGYSICNRNTSKCTQLTSHVVIASGGMQADRASLHKQIGFRLQHYEYRNGKVPGLRAIQQMLSNMLYSRRFFPLYTYNMLAGVDEDGNGIIFGFDVVGCTEALNHGCVGSGRDQIEPLMDMHLNRVNQVGADGKKLGKNEDLTKEEAVELVQDALTSCGERDLETGDHVEIFVITKDGVERIPFELKRD